MAAASYTTDLIDWILDNDTTAWTELTNATAGGAPDEVDTESALQGTNSCSQTTSTANALNSLIRLRTAITPAANEVFLMWHGHGVATALNTYANGGLRTVVATAVGNWKAWAVGGNDVAPFPYAKWVNTPVDPTYPADYTNGTPPTTSIAGVGSMCTVTQPIARGQPHIVDIIRYGRAESRFSGGDLANGYATFAGFASVNDTVLNRWGLIQAAAGGYQWKGLMVLGHLSAVDFRDSNTSIFIQDCRKVYGGFNRIEIRQAGSRVDWANISIVNVSPATNTSKGTLVVVDNADVNLDGCNFTDMDTFSFQSNTSIVNSNFIRCNTVTQGGATIDSCTFNKSTGTTALTTNSLANIGLISNTNFISSGTGYAITVSDSGSSNPEPIYINNFTSPSTPLSGIGATSILTCQSSTFADNSANNFNVTPTGEALIATFNPFSTANNYYSVYFDGNGDYITVPASSAFQWGTGDFTVECWLYTNPPPGGGVANDKFIFGSFNYTPSFVLFLTNSGNQPAIWNGSQQLTASAAVPAYTWTHIAWVRSAGNLTFYINGTSAGTYAYNTNWTAANQAAYIGRSNLDATRHLTRYISNLRVVKGFALYTANFTPSTVPLTSVTGTSLLTCKSSTIIDNSSNNFTLTVAGDTKAVAIAPFANNSNYNSVYFDGVADYLSVVSTSALNFGTDTFSVELWVNFANNPGTNFVILDGRNASQTNSWVLSRNTSNQLQWFSGQTNTFTSTTTLSTVNTWAHIALSRNSTGTFNFWINGVNAGGSGIDNTNYSINSSPLVIGSRFNGQDYLNGYVSNLRVIRGGLRSITVDNIKFTGYQAYQAGGTATGNEAFFVDIPTGAVNISVTGGGSSPSFRTAGAVVTVSNDKTFEISNIVYNSEIRLYTVSGDFELAGVENIGITTPANGVVTGPDANGRYTFTYSHSLVNTLIKVIVINITDLSTPPKSYQPYYQEVTLDNSSNQSLLVSQILDRNYSNP